MNCEEIEELLGAYALDALLPKDAQEMEAHLSSCAKHDDVSELRAVTQSLILAAPDVEPPPALKTRLMEAIHRDAQRFAEPARGEGVGRWLKRQFSQRPVFAIGATASLAAIAALALFLLLPNDGGQTGVVVANFTSTSEATGKIIYVPEEQALTITTEGLPGLSASETYQIWSIRNGTPMSVGFLEAAGDGVALAELPNIHLLTADTVAITVEPAGGSPAPTTTPVLSVKL